MAIDVCPDSPCLIMSPRISFSYDLNQSSEDATTELPHQRSDLTLLDSNSDFNFWVNESFTIESSAADELFSNGKILPMQIKKQSVSVSKQSDSVLKQSIQPKPTCISISKAEDIQNFRKKSLKDFLEANLEEDEKPTSKSFWQFKRSTSLNFESCKNSSLVRFLYRSNSTGSALNPKQSVLAKENQKQNLRKQSSLSSSSPFSHYYPYSSSQKPPLKKNCRSYGNTNCRSYGNTVRISPVLNIPPPCIATLFGFGSFCNGRDKMKKK
ncbi:hypothetical protein RJ641_012230 [Dillenia turbinata]|uniref:Uncharacterized protein n=1 Tax=Dillenia turbinata TaxID=194707 RepID=A0AAN8Z5V9_9MAGN